MTQLKDYLHYYMGCKVMAAPYGGQQKRYEEGRLVGINIHDIAYVKLNNWQLVADISITCVKPMLRRLEDMTEGEMIRLLQTMVPNDMEDKPTGEEYIGQLFKNDGGNLVDADVAVGIDYNCRCYSGMLTIKKCGTICAYDESGDEQELVNAPRAYHYLIQLHFDLFGLIDAGLAVDIKTITP